MDYPRESGAAGQEIPSRLSLSISLNPSLSLSLSPSIYLSFSTIAPQHDYAGKRYDFLQYPVHAEKEYVYERVRVESRKIRTFDVRISRQLRARLPRFPFRQINEYRFRRDCYTVIQFGLRSTVGVITHVCSAEISRMGIQEFDSRLGEPEVNLHRTSISRYLFQSGRWTIEASV